MFKTMGALPQTHMYRCVSHISASTLYTEDNGISRQLTARIHSNLFLASIVLCDLSQQSSVNCLKVYSTDCMMRRKAMLTAQQHAVPESEANNFFA